MSLLAKITKFITPPPKGEDPAVETPAARPEADIARKNLAPLIRRLVEAEELEGDSGRQLLEQIRAAAVDIGYYEAALQMEFILPGLKRKAGKETRLRLYRAYDLSGEFILFHVAHEIDTAQVEGGQLGPNLIGGYCSEAFDCMRSGRQVRSGIESLVRLVESLLLRSVLNPRVAENFRAVAGTAIKTIRDRIEETAEMNEQGFRSAVRRLKRSDMPPPVERSIARRIDRVLVEYVQDTEAKVSILAGGALGQTQGVESTAEFLHAELRSINEVGFLPLSAELKERLGASVGSADQANANAFLGSAAKDFEVQGDREQDVFLPGLSRTRYERAHKLYSQLGDTMGVQRVGSKLLQIDG